MFRNHSIIIILLLGAGFLSACSTSKQASQTAAADVVLDTINVEANRKEYRAAATRVNDLLHTVLDVSFDWEKQYLYGKANLTLKPYFYPVDSLVLNAKGFDVHEVALLAKGDTLPLEYSYDGMKLDIELDKAYSRNEEYKIFIDYTAKPNEAPEGGSEAITSDKGLYFINPLRENTDKPRQIWTQGETEASSRWFPTIDKPNERTTQEMFITVADSFVTLSNGAFIGSLPNADGTRTDHWKQTIPHAPYLFMMAVGDFAVVNDRWRNIEVDYYVEPEYEPYAMQIFGNTPEMMTFYSNILGVEYPWEKYSQIVVRDFVSGAMENTTATVYFSGLQRNARELLDETYEDIIAHELIHHWFGDLVTTESWANLPLNESFATYGEYLWKEYKYGRDEADYHLYNDMFTYLQEARQKKEPLIRYYYDDKEDMFDAHSYQKGGRVLHMLRKYVGDEAFFTALKLYLKEHAYEAVEIHQLRLAFEEVTGEDLNWFFNQWFMSAGHPELEINYDYDDSLNIATVYIGQKQEKPAPGVYKLPLAVDVYRGDNIKRKYVTVDARQDTFRFAVAAKPDLINVDAEKMLLAQVKDNKTFDEYYFQFYHAPLFRDRYDALTYISKSDDMRKEQVLRDALKDSFWVIREQAISLLEVTEEKKKEVLPLVESFALADESSRVRSSAIRKLEETGDTALTGVYQKAVGDSSYLVVSNALGALYSVDEDAALALAGEMEEEDNFNLMTSIAEIYTASGIRGKDEYFERHIANAGGFGKYTLLKFYGDYLATQELEVAKKGLPVLKTNAMENEAWWIRYVAMEAIKSIEEAFHKKKNELNEELREAKEVNVSLAGRIEGDIENIQSFLNDIETARKDILDKETNKRILNLYGRS